jgi:hypothetical protein
MDAQTYALIAQQIDVRETRIGGNRFGVRSRLRHGNVATKI